VSSPGHSSYRLTGIQVGLLSIKLHALLYLEIEGRRCPFEIREKMKKEDD